MDISNLFNVKGKTALITGGSQGIGKAIALTLAEYGADIVIVYRSENQLALGAEADVKKMGVRCELIRSDISELDSVKSIAEALQKKHIEIDILVLNASVQARKPWNEVTPGEYELQMNTNFRSSLFFIQEFYPAMQRKKWGRIVTIGSVQQLRPHQQMIVYSASKLAQVGIVKSLAPQFGKDGITINNLAPGAILTGRNDEVLRDPVYKANVEAKIPVGYIGKASDCAAAALLLCSDAGRYITGQDIFVDGGMGLNF